MGSWNEEANSHAPTSIKILIGAKCELEREVTIEQAKEWANNNKILFFFEVSSLKKINIELLEIRFRIF